MQTSVGFHLVGAFLAEAVDQGRQSGAVSVPLNRHFVTAPVPHPKSTTTALGARFAALSSLALTLVIVSLSETDS